MSKPVSRRDMTPDERRMARALSPGCVSYLPASFDKRWAWGISVAETITEKEAAYLRVMMHRYRRQLPAEVVALAHTEQPSVTPCPHPASKRVQETQDEYAPLFGNVPVAHREYVVCQACGSVIE